MKKTVLISVLLCLAIAGIVLSIILGINLSNTSKKLKSANKEKDKLFSQLLVLETGKAVHNVKQKSALYRRDYVSHFDSQPGSFVLSPPQSAPIDHKYTLVVYLHGMGSNYMEPYVVSQGSPVGQEIRKKYPSFIFASLSYGGETAWGNEKSKSDIDQNIEEISYAYPVEKIVIMGTSMGGSVALNYSASAIEPIKKKIIGVVSVVGSGNLASLYEKTQKEVVKLGIARALGGTPKEKPTEYKNASLVENLSSVNKSVKFAIVSAKQDDTVPPDQQLDVIKALTEKNFKNKLIEVDMGHFYPKSEVYMSALDFVLKK